MERTIKSILIDGAGFIYAEKQIDNDDKLPAGTYRIERNPITRITKNGEMAPVDWYVQGDMEWNGKYVISVEYYPTIKDN